MSFDTGRIEPQFLRPGDAAPMGADAYSGYRHSSAFDEPSDTPAFLHDRTPEARRHFVERRTGKFRRILPILIAAAAAIVFVSLTEGGRNARQAMPLTAYLGEALERVGLGLSEVTVRGQTMTRDSEVYDRLKLGDARSVWLLDTDAARKRIETLPWVLTASLKRIFPDRLAIDIKERSPHVIWHDGRATVLLDQSGRTLGPAAKDRFQGLPKVFGSGAAPHAADIVAAVGRLPALVGKVALYEWTANRRWTLYLDKGRRLLLPATAAHRALERVVSGVVGERLIDGDFKQLDLRLGNRISIDFRQ